MTETNGATIYTQLTNINLRPGEGSTLGIFGWGRAAGTLEDWNPSPTPALVHLNFATLYWT